MKDIPDFVDKTVFKDLNKSSFWLRIYTISTLKLINLTKYF